MRGFDVSLSQKDFIKSLDLGQLTSKNRVELLDKAKLYKRLKVPGYDLKFRIRSRTELSRVSKFKEHWTLDWINSLKQDSVLWDVGANIGIMTNVAAQRPEIAKVVAIEPFFMNYSIIVENLMVNQLSHRALVICGGLGEETGFITLNLQNLVEGGSLHSFGEMFKMPTRTHEPVAEQSCLSYRVDDLVKMPGVDFPTHFKIDIDGFEMSMLRGARETLSDPRVLGIQVETMDLDQENVPQRKKVVSYLEDLGFRLDNEISHGSAKVAVFDLQFVR